MEINLPFELCIVIFIASLISCLLLVLGPEAIRNSHIPNASLVFFLYLGRAIIIFFDPSSLILPLSLNIVVGVPIFAIGTIIILISLVKIRVQSIKGASSNNTLMTEGLYGLVRHPIYLGEILWPIGFALFLNKNISLWISFGLIFYFIVYAKLEERTLVRAYGDKYREYQQRVPMLIPIKLKRKKTIKESI